MAGVTDTYYRYEAVGDQYCGKPLSALPLFFVVVFFHPPPPTHFRLNELE